MLAAMSIITYWRLHMEGHTYTSMIGHAQQLELHELPGLSPCMIVT